MQRESLGKIVNQTMNIILPYYNLHGIILRPLK